MKDTTRWLNALLIAAAIIAVELSAVVPHYETEDAGCVICKAGSHPFHQVAAVTAPDVDAPPLTAVPTERTTELPLALGFDNTSRAPPA